MKRISTRKTDSAYRSEHSVKSAILLITDSALRYLDINKSVIVILFDLSMTFDTIDLQLLFDSLKYSAVSRILHWRYSEMRLRWAAALLDWRYVYLKFKNGCLQANWSLIPIWPRSLFSIQKAGLQLHQPSLFSLVMSLSSPASLREI